jgi:hypothetical protein
MQRSDSADTRRPHPYSVRGVVVFSPEFLELPTQAVTNQGKAYIGRQYVKLPALISSQPVLADESIYFVPSPDADVYEEVVAWETSRDTVVLRFSPQVMDFGPVFRGVQHGDTISGTWELHGAESRFSGDFTMIHLPTAPMVVRQSNVWNGSIERSEFCALDRSPSVCWATVVEAQTTQEATAAQQQGAGGRPGERAHPKNKRNIYTTFPR